MSRLKRYIVEEGELTNYLNLIEKECQPYIKAIRGGRGILRRSIPGKFDFLKKSVRKNRRPLDTDPKLHEWFDEYFLEKFGWRARSNVIFCWGTPVNYITLYEYIVFPIGKFKFIWSPVVEDLYNLEDFRSFDIEVDTYEDLKKLYTEIYGEVNKTYTDKNLKKALVSDNEIMVNCKEVYLVKGHFLLDIDEKLNLKLQGLRRTKIG